MVSDGLRCARHLSAVSPFYQRVVLVLFTVPILAKWILIGRWKCRSASEPGLCRFWVVKTLVRRNPIVMFTGSPLFNVYLRLLGAKVGRGVVILSNHVPICTDLLTSAMARSSARTPSSTAIGRTPGVRAWDRSASARMR